MNLICVACGRSFVTPALEEFCPRCSRSSSGSRGALNDPSPPVNSGDLPVGIPMPESPRRSIPRWAAAAIFLLLLTAGGYLLWPRGGDSAASPSPPVPNDGSDLYSKLLRRIDDAADRGIPDPAAAEEIRQLPDRPRTRFLRGLLELERRLLPHGPFEPLFHRLATYRHMSGSRNAAPTLPVSFPDWKAAADAARHLLDGNEEDLPPPITSRAKALLALADLRFKETKIDLSASVTSHPKLHPLLAWSHLALGELEEADAAAEASRETPALLLVRAQTALLRDRPTVAERLADQILAADPSHPAARDLRALALVLQIDPDKRRAAEKLVADNTLSSPSLARQVEALAAQMARDWTKLERAQTVLLETLGKSSPHLRLPRALARLRLGEYAGAWEDAEACRDSFPGTSFVQKIRIEILDGRGDLEKAAEECTSALARFPEDELEFLLNRAYLLLALGKDAESGEDFARLTSGSTTSQNLFFQRFTMHQSNNDLAGGERTAREWSACYPNDAGSHLSLGSNLFQQKRYPESAEALTRSLRLQQRPEFFLGRSGAYHQAGEHLPALEDLEQAIRLTDASPENRLDQIHLLIHLDRTSDADEKIREFELLVGENRARISPLLKGRFEAMRAWRAAEDPARASEHLRTAADSGFDPFAEIHDETVRNRLSELPAAKGVQETLDRLRAAAAEQAGRQAFLGVQYFEDRNQIRVTVPRSPARASGARFGDRITHLDGVSIHALADLQRELRRFTPGRKITLRLLRQPGMPDERPYERSVTLMSRPVQ